MQSARSYSLHGRRSGVQELVLLPTGQHTGDSLRHRLLGLDLHPGHQPSQRLRLLHVYYLSLTLLH